MAQAFPSSLGAIIILKEKIIIGTEAKRITAVIKQARFKSRYSAIGVDLGNAKIKMLQLRHNSGELSVYRKRIFPTPDGSILHGKIIEPEKITAALKMTKAKPGWHGNKVNLCLDSDACYMRTVVMPPLKRGDLERAMRLEAEKSFSLSPGEAVIGYSFNRKTSYNNSPANEYLLAAALKKTADAYTNAALKAGFQPESVEVKPLALKRSFACENSRRFNDSDDCHLLLDLGYSSTGLLIVSGEDHCFYRNIGIGLFHFQQSLVKDHSGDLKTARLKLLSADRKMGHYFEQTAAGLTRSIIQSVEYWNDQSGEKTQRLSTLCICGGGTVIPQVTAHLQENLHLTLMILNPLNIESSLQKIGHNSPKTVGPLFFVSRGLALKGWYR